MIKVYVAGAYSADNVIDVLQNIGRGEECAARLFAVGFAPFCPWHDKSYAITLHDFKFVAKDFQDFSLAWLKVSDCVFLVPGWEESKGTAKEIELAEQLNIPVFKSMKKLLHFKRQRETQRNNFPKCERYGCFCNKNPWRMDTKLSNKQTQTAICQLVNSDKKIAVINYIINRNINK